MKGLQKEVKIMKFLAKEDLLKNNYAIVEWDEEDGMFYLISLHKEKEMAQKRLKYLNNQAKKLFLKGIYSCIYCLWETTDERIKWDEEDKEIYIVRR